MARVPAGWPAPKAAAISMTPAVIAHTPTISTRTSAVGPGQASAITSMARAKMPQAVKDVLSDLNVAAFLSLASLPGAPVVSGPPGRPLDKGFIMIDD